MGEKNHSDPQNEGEMEHFIKREYPQEQPVADPRFADPPATPDPVVWDYDPATGEKKTAYAALIHRLVAVKGRIVDRGWEIRWFNDSAEAAEVDAKARLEAASYMTARRLEAELTAGVEPGELPVPMVAEFVSPTPPISQIMEKLGFTPEQYRIEGEGPGHRKEVVSTGSYLLPMHQWGDTRDSKYGESYEERDVQYWWYRDKEGIIVLFDNTTIEILLGKKNYDQGVARSFATEENFKVAKDWLEAECQKAEAEYRAQVREFVEALRVQPAYACLLPDMQTKLDELALNGWGTPKLPEAELRSEWAKAEALRHRVENKECLVNFRGHFRRMGMSGNCDLWVIQSDGILRDPDKISRRKLYPEGNKAWRLVGPAEIALRWSAGTMHNPAGSSDCVVAKRPIGGGCTMAQLQKVRELELELGVHTGSFGLDAKALTKEKSVPVIASPVVARPKEPETPVDLSKVDLSKLFGGSARRK